MADDCCFSGWLADHCEWYLQLVVVPSVKTTVDAHPRNHNSLASDYFWGIHRIPRGRIPCGRETPPIAHSSRQTYSRTLSKWLTSCVLRECLCAGNIWDIFKFKDRNFLFWNRGEKSWWRLLRKQTQREKNLPEEIRLHAWTFGSHSRTIKSNQERGESWDFRSQRLNFLVIHRQKLNLEEFDSEVSIARKKKTIENI